jgi:tripartite motif-containing protein 71
MKIVFIAAVTATFAAAMTFGTWVYEGQWGSYGLGPGLFRNPSGVAVAPTGHVYTSDGVPYNPRVQYFTPTGSFLGWWPVVDIHSVAVAYDGTVYAAAYRWGMTYPVLSYIRYFTANGSLLGSWIIATGALGPWGVEGLTVSPGGRVYVANMADNDIRCFGRRGYFLRKWGRRGSRPGEFNRPRGVAFTPTGRVYVADTWNHRVQFFTATGEFLGQWGSKGSGPGQFDSPEGITVAPATGYVYVADTDNNRVQYFTANGAFIGAWGFLGRGPGAFRSPEAVAVTFSGNRLYVADSGNNRVQYFNRNEPSVAPASVGRVKALFR